MSHKIGQIAEYGSDEFKNNQSVLTVIESKDYVNDYKLARHVEFYTRTEGYKDAGSCATWTAEVWGFRFFIDGCSYGKFSTDKDAMKAEYDKLGQNTSK
jgi:hypothetical protein